ncbi:MAG TPA: sulfur oxidation c-type cytochrome SoxX [Caldimonas sp.]
MKAFHGIVSAAMALGACASTPNPAALDQMAQAMIQASFREQGIARLDRLNQDAVQQACSAPEPPTPAVARQLEAAAQATIRWPADGIYLGDWREGEKLAQNGRGMTWTDGAGVPGGGNCYNCHQLTKTEISFGTIGPSLYQYGKLRGVTNPLDPASAPVVQYAWGKLWNSKASNVCSTMPRFGHAGVLTQAQIRDLMALLLDPASPVNAP